MENWTKRKHIKQYNCKITNVILKILILREREKKFVVNLCEGNKYKAKYNIQILNFLNLN